MEEEIWKDIPNYEGIYQVSNLGNVKSLSRTIMVRGKYPFVTADKILKPGGCRRNYLTVALNDKSHKVHKLVAMAFLNHEPCGFKFVINHKNFIMTDNRVENLEIVTHRENTNQKHIKSSSVYTGVSWDNSAKKWKSQIYVNSKWVYLGTFDDELEASKYYENALLAIKNGEEIKVKLVIKKQPSLELPEDSI